MATMPAHTRTEPAVLGIVGRDEETAALLQLLADGGPRAAYVHGVAGVGKSCLLERFAHEARRAGAVVLELDGRDVEPTERGFLDALARAARQHGLPADGIRQGDPVVVSVDAYDSLRLLDRWCGDWARRLPAGMRVVVAAREPPSSSWLRVPGLRALALGPLPARDAEALLLAAGLTREAAARINRLVRGYPLALAVAATTERLGRDVAETAVQRAIAELTRVHLDNLDPGTRRLVEAAAVVRRLTVPLLTAMLPDVDGDRAFDRLRRLPFVEGRADGIVLHEAIQAAVDELLRATDPDRRRAHRRAAWQTVRRQLREDAGHDLWRRTADMLYLIENPVVREAFFPAEPRPLRVEPAATSDAEGIRSLVARYDPDSLGAFETWWTTAPDSFGAIRDAEDALAGFHCVLRPGAVTPRTVRADPVAEVWWRHLREDPMPGGQQAIFDRWELAADTGDRPSAVQAAAWLEIKRMYLEMRPRLRRVYSVMRDRETYLPTLRHLGFTTVSDEPVVIGATSYWCAVLDFGPASVDGWLSWLAAKELGIEADGRLDEEARAIVVNGRPVPLTAREFEVLRRLAAASGRPVARRDLLREVWGYEHWGTNVVDVVVRSIRAKLGQRAHMVETVRGVGYRFSPER